MDQLEMGLKLSSNDRNRERILQERDLQILEKIALLCSGCVPLTSYDASLRGNLNCEQFGMIGSTIYKDF